MGKRIGADGFPEYSGFWWTLALPQVILVVHVTMAAAACGLASRRTAHPAGIVPMGVLAGWLFWTAFEYVLHRWLLHHTSHPVLRRIFWETAHKEHHSYRAMRDPDHHGVHIAITVPLAALSLVLASRLDQGALGLSAAAGWLLGYCSYEALHWLFHGLPPESRVWRLTPLGRLFEAHTVHHLVQANRNFGFVTQFWDRRFGTESEGLSTAASNPVGEAS